MNITKKILTSLLCTILLLSMLISCGEGKKTDGTTDAGTEAEVTTEEVTVTEKEPYVPVVDDWVSAIYGGGPFVTGGKTVHDDIKNSGFNTLMIWSVHVAADGTLSLNDTCAVKNGEWQINFPKGKKMVYVWDDLLVEGSSITRIELSVGAWGTKDFENIRSLMQRDGDGEDTILYKNFKCLIDKTHASAVNFDDESCYDADAMANFGKMCGKMGMKITLCPYTSMSFWKSLKDKLGDLCDRIYVQCYDGGAWNNPADWTSAMGMKVIPGYWCLHGGAGDTASSVGTKIKNSGNAITGGFMWLYDDMQKLTGKNTTADYAAAINAGKKK